MARPTAIDDNGNDTSFGDPNAGQNDVTAAMVRDLFDKGSKDVQPEIMHYWINRAFHYDEQWVSWNSFTFQLEFLERTDDNERLTLNRLRPATRRLIARIMRQPLRFQVLPDSADDPALTGAKVSEAVLEDTCRKHDWEGLRRRHLYATWLGGTGGVCVEWDPSLGEDLGDDDETGRSVGTGDTVETVLSIAEMVTEPGAKDIEHGRWWIKAAAMPCADAQKKFKLKEKPKSDAGANLSPLQAKLLRDGRPESGAATEMCLVLTYFERPNAKRKQGCVATVVGGQMVDGPHPWPFPFKDRLNLSVCAETVGDNWFGSTIFSTAVSPQVSLNKIWSSVTEHVKKAGNARMIAPESAIDIADKVTDDPGDILFYNPSPNGKGPEYLSPPTMPQWWTDHLAQCKQEIDDILGVSPSSTMRPGQLRSAQALMVLGDSQDATTVDFANETGRVWEKTARMVLEVYEAKVEDTRDAYVTRGRATPASRKWSGKNLNGQTNATIPDNSLAPKSQEQRFQMAQQLAAMGVFGTPVNGPALARFLDQPDTNDLLAELDPNEAKAQRENEEMADGRVCVPADFDDHKVHINNHNVMRLSKAFELLPIEAQQLISMHIQAHETMAAEQAGQVEGQAMVSPLLAAAPSANAPEIPGGLMAALNGGAANAPAPAKGAPGVAAQPPPGGTLVSPEQPGGIPGQNPGMGQGGVL